MTVRSRDAIGRLIGDFAKIILAGYFAGEFFAKLDVVSKCVFWLVFFVLVLIYFLISIERGDAN
ncbi:MAG: hypothetical protein ABIH69_01365 [bacterium]